MEETKAWYTSRTIWVMIITIAAMILSLFKIQIGPAEQTFIVDAILKIIELVGGLLVIVFRFMAKKQLTATATPTK